MTEREELRPCPFCGGRAGCMGNDAFGYWLECGGCNATLGMYSDTYDETTGYYDTRDGAIAAWNRRAEG